MRVTAGPIRSGIKGKSDLCHIYVYVTRKEGSSPSALSFISIFCPSQKRHSHQIRLKWRLNIQSIRARPLPKMGRVIKINRTFRLEFCHKYYRYVCECVCVFPNIWWPPMIYIHILSSKYHRYRPTATISRHRATLTSANHHHPSTHCHCKLRLTCLWNESGINIRCQLACLTFNKSTK